MCDALRYDRRDFLACVQSVGLEMLAVKRRHIELFRHHIEQRGLAASTMDRRLATVCGLYLFAHIDGRIHPSLGSVCTCECFPDFPPLLEPPCGETPR